MPWPNIHVLIQIFILAYFLAVNSLYSLLYWLAFWEVGQQHKRSFIDDYPYLNRSKLAPGVSLLVPAYNEEKTILESLKSHLCTKYPKFEVIVINDGSTDKTLDVLKKEYKLKKIEHVAHKGIKTAKVKGYYLSPVQPNLIVIDKKNGGGKADSLNVGLNEVHYPYFVSMDADVILEEDAMLRIMRPMLDDPEKNIVSGGIVRVVNGCVVQKGAVKEVKLSRNLLVNFQTIEYMRAFNAGRAGFARMKALMLVSGAFGVFNTEIGRKAGGYKSDTIGEDMELLVKIHHYLVDKQKKYNVLYLAYPVCWTEVPETLRSLGGQRNRWYRGTCEVIGAHKRMLFNPRYGRLGLVGLPYFFIFEVMGALIEFLGYFYIAYLYLAGRLDLAYFFSFLAIAILWGALLSVTAVLYEELNFDWYKKWYYTAKLIMIALLENFGYRQLNVLWRVSGLIDFLRGKKAWGAMPRRGFQTKGAQG